MLCMSLIIEVLVLSVIRVIDSFSINSQTAGRLALIW